MIFADHRGVDFALIRATRRPPRCSDEQERYSNQQGRFPHAEVFPANGFPGIVEITCE